MLLILIYHKKKWAGNIAMLLVYLCFINLEWLQKLVIYNTAQLMFCIFAHFYGKQSFSLNDR